jgi:hypothetical protein
MPWAGQAMINIINGQLRPSRPITLSLDNNGNKLWELMNRCWAGVPSERPNSGDVYKTVRPANMYIMIHAESCEVLAEGYPDAFPVFYCFGWW